MTDQNIDDGLHTEDHDAWDFGGYCNALVTRNGDTDVCRYRRSGRGQVSVSRGPLYVFPRHESFCENTGPDNMGCNCGAPKGGWPCSKREAHGPHVAWPRNPDYDGYDCPGVKAHPNTMIGRA